MKQTIHAYLDAAWEQAPDAETKELIKLLYDASVGIDEYTAAESITRASFDRLKTGVDFLEQRLYPSRSTRS